MANVPHCSFGHKESTMAQLAPIFIFSFFFETIECITFIIRKKAKQFLSGESYEN